MGLKIGIVALHRPKDASRPNMMQNLFYRAELLDQVKDADLVFGLPEERAMVGTAGEYLLIASASLAYSIVSRPSFLPVPKDENWLLAHSENGSCLAAYMYSVVEICGYVAIENGHRIASHFHIDGDNQFGPVTENPAAWLQKVPSSYTETYVPDLMEAYLGQPLSKVLKQVRTWERYAVK